MTCQAAVLALLADRYLPRFWRWRRGSIPELKNPTVDCNAETDKLLSRSLLEFFRDCWLGGTGVAYDDTGVNPLSAKLAGLPPVSVYYGEHELLAGEAIEFADRAKGAALDVHLDAVAEGQHSFILGAGRVPEADQAIAKMGRRQ